MSDVPERLNAALEGRYKIERQLGEGGMATEWPATPDGEFVELRSGSNNWTCLADNPAIETNDPMCNDADFMAWAQAYMSRTEPTATGISYMLQGGSTPSNSEPFAEEPAAGEDMVVDGPHIMITVPDPSALDGMSDDWRSGGPYVMWKGTPYAHIMVPVD